MTNFSNHHSRSGNVNTMRPLQKSFIWTISVTFLLCSCINFIRLIEAGVCTNSGLACSDCRTVVQCTENSDGTFQEDPIPCPGDTFCVRVDDSVAACPKKGDSTIDQNCQCPADGIGYFTDPFDPSKYLICHNGEGFPQTCDGELHYDAEERECVEPSTTTTPIPITCDADGFFPISETNCKEYKLCIKIGNNYEFVNRGECAENTFLDVDTQKCVPESNFDVNFECKAGIYGAVIDPYDCYAFRICYNGDQLGDIICCPDGKIFDNVQMTCLPIDEAAACQEINQCVAHKYEHEKVCAPSATTEPPAEVAV